MAYTELPAAILSLCGTVHRELENTAWNSAGHFTELLCFPKWGCLALWEERLKYLKAIQI